MQAPTSITTVLAAIDGAVVKIGWIDPNTTVTSKTARVFTVDASGNATTTEMAVTKSTSGCWAYLVAGQYALAIKDNTSGQQSTSVVFTTAAATVPPPPVVLTEQQMIQNALGITLASGDLVQVYPPAPTTSKTVQSDGSIS